MTLFFFGPKLHHVTPYFDDMAPDVAPLIVAQSRDGWRNGKVENSSVDFSLMQRRRQTPRKPLVEKNTVRIQNVTQNQDKIRVLIWTDSPLVRKKKTCHTSIPCEYTYDHSLYNSSDVVVLYTRLVRRRHNMPSFRDRRQHWVRFLRESPIRFRLRWQPYETWFNWTITYSMDGDVVLPYGMCLPSRDKVARDPSSITDIIRRVYGKSAESTPWETPGRPHQYTPHDHAKGRTRLVLWAVGHCATPSRRENYVAELRRHIDVDIFGKCVNNSICRGHVKSGCMDDVYKTYKFYLAFENSLCNDYITEKVWTRLQIGIVPVVLGGADYKTHLPPHSYIDVKDYSSPKELANYLHTLNNNDILYNEYFAWKQNYSCTIGVPGVSLSCELCKMMNKNRHKVNMIPDINKFWGPDSCVDTSTYYKRIAPDILLRTLSTNSSSGWPSFEVEKTKLMKIT